ncbi:maternal B9.15 protein [Lingula anatina]|uniref:Maternal B9.15 protein n=1 Tax=Lingula anatina TaxID=7574 RepID=A0A1S3I8G5_LINAN|nr:maternal B9.15 protein [Lingula anatina]|eukprot:XP_013394547.1 maternal B9.15 protein [Lingula anatina]
MKDEIAAAVVFISRLLESNKQLSPEKAQEFSAKLSDILGEKFKNHWYQDKPTKGQAFRCIRVNETEPRDPVLEKAASESGLKYEELNLPLELTLWVDPHEVACRFGESHNSYCTVASFKGDSKENNANTINIEAMVEKTQKHMAGSGSKQGPFKTFRTNKKGSHFQHHLQNNSKNNSNYQLSSFNIQQQPFYSQHNTKPKHQQHYQKGSGDHQQQGQGHLKHQHQASLRPSKPFHSKVGHSSGFNARKQDKFHWVRGADLVKA